MKVEAYDKPALSRFLRKGDFYKDALLSDDNYRDNLLESSVSQADNLFFGSIHCLNFYIAGRKNYSATDLSQKLVLRKCASEVRGVSSRVRKSRSQIARELRVYLNEGVPYYIFKLDIKSFFENIDGEALKASLYALNGLSTHSKKILEKIIASFEAAEGVSVPRGVETSPVLAGEYLNEFDRFVRSRKDVFYYSRFVDDIVILASDKVDPSVFVSSIEGFLPKGLYFNAEKTQKTLIRRRRAAGSLTTPRLVGSFSYLGFQFNVLDPPLPIRGDSENARAAAGSFRRTSIDLSEDKIKRTKEKLSKAFFSYAKNRDYELLRDRVSFLTSNREFTKKDDSVVIPVGVYYSNSACDVPSESMGKLDCYLRYLIFGTSGRLPKLYLSFLTKNQKKELASYGFAHGFQTRVHRRFSMNRLGEIVRIWK